MKIGAGAGICKIPEVGGLDPQSSPTFNPIPILLRVQSIKKKKEIMWNLRMSHYILPGLPLFQPFLIRDKCSLICIAHNNIRANSPGLSENLLDTAPISCSPVQVTKSPG